MTRSRWLAFLCGAAPTSLALVVCSHLKQPSSIEASPKPSLAKPQQSVTEASSLLHQWNAHGKVSLIESITYLESIEAGKIEALLRVAGATAGKDPDRFQRLFDRLAELDTSAALDFASSTWPLEERLTRIKALVCRWAAEDPDTCWEWLSTNYQISQATLWNPFLRSVYGERSLGEPTSNEMVRSWKALERIAKTPDGFSSERFIQGVIEDPHTRQPLGSLWFLVNDSRRSGNWRGTMERLSEIGGDRLGWGWADLVFTHWKVSDFAEATSWNEARRDLGLSGCDGRSGYARVKVDLAGDVDWIFKNRRFDRLSSLGGSHLAEQAVLLSSIDPDDPSYDDVRLDLSEALEGVDIQAAIAWAQTIVKPLTQDLIVKRTVRHWAEFEPLDAEAYAREQLGWSAEEFAEALIPERL